MIAGSAARSDAGAVLSALEARARRHHTPCGDGTMVWRTWGDGPPLVLLHGSHGSWAHWVRNIERLAQERSVWAPDLPGLGESALPTGNDHAAIVWPIAAGLRALLPADRPVDVVGFSFGGVVATHLAAREPALVRRLVIVDPGGLDTPLGSFRLRRMRDVAPDRREAATRENLLALMLRHPESVDELALRIQSDGSRRSRLNPGPLIMPDHLVRVLPQVRAPIAAIWGEHDAPHPDPAAQERALRRHAPKLRFRVMPDAGHWCMYERPEAFAAALLDLLGPVEPGE